MSAEHTSEPHPEQEPIDVKIGVPFYPFEKAKEFKPVKHPLIASQSTLSMPLSFFEMHGGVDVIAETPISYYAKYMMSEFQPPRMPFGEPAIYSLGVNFTLKNQKEFAILSSTYINATINDEEYYLLWQARGEKQKHTLHELRQGQEQTIFDQNFMHESIIRELEERSQKGVEMSQNSRLVNFLMLPKDIDALKKIRFTFHWIDDHDSDETTTPSDPLIEKELVLV